MIMNSQSRVHHYLHWLSDKEMIAERQHYSEEPNSRIEGFDVFINRCRRLQERDKEPSQLWDTKDFRRAYWNLNKRVVTALMKPGHPDRQRWDYVGDEIVEGARVIRRVPDEYVDESPRNELGPPPPYKESPASPNGPTQRSSNK